MSHHPVIRMRSAIKQYNPRIMRSLNCMFAFAFFNWRVVALLCAFVVTTQVSGGNVPPTPPSVTPTSEPTPSPTVIAVAIASGNSPHLSDDGGMLVFENGDAYVYNRISHSLRHVASAYDAMLSGDGRYVIYADFESPYSRVYRYDLETNATVIVSRSAHGHDVPCTSFSRIHTVNGRYVAFSSNGDLVSTPTAKASNYMDVYLRDVDGGTISLASLPHGSNGVYLTGTHSYRGVTSENGDYVAFTNGGQNVIFNRNSGLYIRDMDTVVTSTGSFFYSGDINTSPSMTPDGRYLLFLAQGLVRYDRVLNSVRTVVPAAEMQFSPSNYYNYGISSISSDGQYVVFAAKLTGSSRVRVYLRDLNAAGQSVFVTLSVGAAQNFDCHSPSISRDGSTMAFECTDGKIYVVDEVTSYLP